MKLITETRKKEKGETVTLHHLIFDEFHEYRLTTVQLWKLVTLGVQRLVEHGEPPPKQHPNYRQGIRARSTLSIQFSDAEKEEMILILEQGIGGFAVIPELIEILRLPGETVLPVDHAQTLGGLVRPYYPSISNRILNHPAVEGDPSCTP